MKRVSIWLVYIVLFALFFLWFAPKKLLYYKLEHILHQQQIILSDETIYDNFFSFHVEDAKLFVKDIEVGQITKASLYPEFFINALIIKDFNTNKSISLLPKIEIRKLIFLYTPFYPIKIFIKGEASDGEIKGSIELMKRKGFIDIASKKPLPLKKTKEGYYRYEFSY